MKPAKNAGTRRRGSSFTIVIVVTFSAAMAVGGLIQFSGGVKTAVIKDKTQIQGSTVIQDVKGPVTINQNGGGQQITGETKPAVERVPSPDPEWKKVLEVDEPIGAQPPIGFGGGGHPWRWTREGKAFDAPMPNGCIEYEARLEESHANPAQRGAACEPLLKAGDTQLNPAITCWDDAQRGLKHDPNAISVLISDGDWKDLFASGLPKSFRGANIKVRLTWYENGDVEFEVGESYHRSGSLKGYLALPFAPTRFDWIGDGRVTLNYVKVWRLERQK